MKTDLDCQGVPPNGKGKVTLPTVAVPVPPGKLTLTKRKLVGVPTLAKPVQNLPGKPFLKKPENNLPK